MGDMLKSYVEYDIISDFRYDDRIKKRERELTINRITDSAGMGDMLKSHVEYGIISDFRYDDRIKGHGQL